MALNLIFFGPPGVGKGTAAKKIAAKYNITHISSGDLLRDEVDKQTEIALKIKSIMNAGKLVPDETVLELVADKIMRSKSGFILDGYPRNLHQAKMLDEILKGLEIEITVVFELHASDEAIIQRLSGRRQCHDCAKIYHLQNMPSRELGKCDGCSGELYQRSDDKPEVIKERLAVYRETTAELLAYYREKGMLKKANFSGNIDQNVREIEKIIEKLK